MAQWATPRGTWLDPGCTAAPGPGVLVYLLNSTSCRQKLVFYDSSEELDKDSPDADPWLPAWTPEGSPHGDQNSISPYCR